MRKEWFLALAILAPLAAATPARALDTHRQYTVQFDGSTVGFWTLRSKVAPANAGGNSVCRYTVKWSDLAGPPLGRTALCKIDELAAGDNFDCAQSSRTGVNTVVQKAPGTCRGFDDFGQQTTISTLVGGEDSGGSINGVVLTASVGDVQNLTVN